LKALSVPKSSYFYTLKHPEQSITQKYHHLKAKIKKSIKGHSSYGYRNIQKDLADEGVIINHKPLKKLLKALNLAKKRKFKFPKPSPLAQYIKELGAKANLVNRLTEIKPLRVFLTDFSEIDCLFGKFKFILFSDMLTKRIGGANSSYHKDSDNALKAYSKLKRYLKAKNISLTDVVVHQDQDPVFVSYEYAGRLTNNGIALSFTERGFKDNQMMESCIGHFKQEYKQRIQQAETLKEAQQIFKASVKDWNTKRRHSALKGRSPDDFIHTLKID
jgi:transposase InsO family protein